jgi:hypothetical protein
MTESATRTRQLNVSQIVTKAFKLAGVCEWTQSLETAQLNEGASVLDMICDELAADGSMAKTQEEQSTTLLAATQEYSLAADVLDIDSDGRLILTGETAEHNVKKIDQQRWENIGDKTQTGMPTMLFAYRAEETIQLRVWPIPTASDVGVMRYIVHRLRGDTAPTTTVTPGAERYWNLYFVHELARYVAQAHSMNLGRISTLSQQAQAYKARALNIARYQGSRKFKVNHPTGWQGR